ncbi:T9SS type A sorting domain-containing protein [Mucilaginibacter sp. HMF5004]|uniref:T9SS type A sorting domain-containing protein n=1 Tax=Mucilaginibacter rivuli TaxID=2857527 RepID=UPI001C5FAC0E|nr:T9SS type A sorting domain-containing protein [Mucilaginibacter rivuli]MBW4889826.1 T9SS type A sorting domain-containing protein [Mucilaginibacter rivuli]
MKKYILPILLLFATVLSGKIACAQSISRDVVANAAETFVQPGLTLSTTLGEPYGELLVNAGANLFFTTGFAQPDIDVQTILGLSNANSLILFPNPATGGTVKLSFNHVPDGVYTVSLIDASGKVLSSQEVNYSLGAFAYLPIDVSRLSGGVYFIRVFNRVNFQGQVKLIKI